MPLDIVMAIADAKRVYATIVPIAFSERSRVNSFANAACNGFARTHAAITAAITANTTTIARQCADTATPKFIMAAAAGDISLPNWR